MVLDKLVQLIIDCARTRVIGATTQKAKAARAFVRLHCAIKECHEAYIRVRSVEPNPPSYAESAAWTRTVDYLSYAFGKVKNQLEVFAPHVHTVVRGYVDGETGLARTVGLPRTPAQLDALIDQGSVVPALRSSCKSRVEEQGHPGESAANPTSADVIPDIGGSELAKAVEDVASCERASDLLGAFIKENFKIEDLF